MNIIPNHSNMTALEMGLSPDILIHDNLRPMSVDDRLDEYRAKLRHAIKSGHGVTCEVVRRKANIVIGPITAMTTAPNNISKLLRKGAK